MIDFIEEQLGAYGVELICAVLPISLSTYYEHRARRLARERPVERETREDLLRAEIRRVFDENTRFTARTRSGVSIQAHDGDRQAWTEGARSRAPRLQAERLNQLWVADLTY